MYDVKQLDGPSLLAAGTIEIRTVDGERLGTGTIVSASGKAVTCFHVVADHAEVQVNSATGATVVIPVDADALDEARDFAILQTPFRDVRPVPIHAGRAPLRWYARGYQDESLGFRGAVSISGTASAAGTRIYEIGGRRYQLESNFDLRGDATVAVPAGPA